MNRSYKKSKWLGKRWKGLKNHQLKFVEVLIFSVHLSLPLHLRWVSSLSHVVVLVGIVLIPLHVVAVYQRLNPFLQVSRLGNKRVMLDLVFFLKKNRVFQSINLEIFEIMQSAWLKVLMKERPYNSLNFRKDNLVRKKGKCSLKDFI